MAQRVVSLTDRSRRVLQYLLRLGDAVSAREVGSRLGLTTPQVRYCLRSIELWLAARGYVVARKPHLGIWVQASAAERAGLLDELRDLGGYAMVLTPDDRQQVIYLRLLTSPDPVRPADLGDEFGISRTSVFRDMDVARTWLRRHGLRLTSKRRSGLRVEGREADWRLATIDLMTRNLSQSILLAACAVDDLRKIGQSTSSQAFLREACDYLRTTDLRHGEQLTTALERKLGVTLVDDARIGLVLHLGLVWRRVTEGHTIREAPYAARLHPTLGELDATGVIVREIEAATRCTLPEGEHHYLAELVAGSMKTGFVSRREAENADRQPAADLSGLAQLLAREAAKYLHAGLAFDKELIDCLALELAAARSARPAFRPKSGDRVEGARAGILKEFARRMLQPVLERGGHIVTDETLTLIAQHLETSLQRLVPRRGRRRVWVVCGAHLATARNLVSRLRLNLPEVEIVGIASAFDLMRDATIISGADAIVSTIALDWIQEIPVVIVSAMLHQEDMRALRAALDLLPAEAEVVPGKGAQHAPSITSILSADSIEIGARVVGWEGVVDHAGALLLKVDAIWPSYVEAMKDMIRLYGPYMVVTPGAALLHASPEMGAKRLAMSLVVPETPVAFGHPAHDPVCLALAISSVDYEAHLRALEETLTLVADPPSRASLAQATTGADAIQRIRDRLGRLRAR